MKSKRWKVLSRILAFCIALNICVTDSHAVFKEIKVWGAQSANDWGFSDNNITMEELREDYHDFEQTDGLREYFHKDQDNPYKADLSEELSWLIDHEIINRDETVTISNISDDEVPEVTISKVSVEDLESKTLKRSDLIMYLYKAVYGPIDARTVGVEIPNIRVDTGEDAPDPPERDTLQNIMDTNGYMTDEGSVIVDGIMQEIHDGETGTGGSGTVGGDGGVGAEADAEITAYLNDSENWRYTPQGDEYDAMWGDTNIFISQNDFEQTVNAGEGGAGGEATAIASGLGNVAQAAGGGGGGGGSGQNAIQYETDYKQVYYVTGKDLMFYRTNDVLELYLQNALSKGILDDESYLRTDKFTDTLIREDESNNQLESWSPYAPAFILNRKDTKQITYADVKVPSRSEETLGVNFNIDFGGSELTITRNNLFEADSGYFSTERIFKIDAYRYIYRFLCASEKKVSELEADIVNYKYGLDLEGIAPADDVKVIKYLVAKGILNYDEYYDFNNLYAVYTYSEFMKLLYRVANPNARLDFSLIQLTDSETAWKANGYAPQTLYVTNEKVPTVPMLNYTEEWYKLLKNHPEREYDLSEYEEEYAEAITPITVTYAADGSVISASYSSPSELLTRVETSPIMGEETSHVIKLGDTILANKESDNYIAKTLFFQGHLTLNFEGLAIDSSKVDELFSESYLDSLIVTDTIFPDKLTDNALYEEYTSGKLLLGGGSLFSFYYLDNLFALSLYKNSGLQTTITHKLDEYVKNKAETFKTTGDTSTREHMIMGRTFKKKLETNMQEYANVISSFKVDIRRTAGGDTETLDGGAFVTTYGGSNVSQGVTYIAGVSLDYEGSNTDSTHITLERTSSFEQFSEDTESAVKNANEKISFKATVPLSSTEVVGGTGAYELSTADAQASRGESNYIRLWKNVSDGKEEAYVSWKSIEDYNNTPGAVKIPIVRQGDSLLYNEETNTYAYFSSNDSSREKSTALVGTAIVTTNSPKGVAFKNDVDNEYYYLYEAIRLLINPKQEAGLVSGINQLAIDVKEDPKSVSSKIRNFDYYAESGEKIGTLNGLKILISTDFEKDKADNPSIKLFQDEAGIIVDSDDGTKYFYVDYLAVSQSNRVMNIVTRRMTYHNDEGKTESAYAVVMFNPVDIEGLGTATVNENTTIEELLNAPGLGPQDSEGAQAAFEENKKLCNAYANWIYGTVDQEYINTGYVRPDVYLYAQGGAVPTSDPIFSQLTSDLVNRITQRNLTLVSSGNVAAMDAKYPPKAINASDSVMYYLSSDYNAAVVSDRLYMLESKFSNLTRVTEIKGGAETFSYRADNFEGTSARFAIGSSFEFDWSNIVPGYSSFESTKPNVKGFVVKTESNGTITAQIGPIIGTPIKYEGHNAVISADSYLLEGATVSKSLSTATNSSDSNWDTSVYNPSFNRIRFVTEKLESMGIDIVGVTESPSYALVSSTVLGFNGKELEYFKSGTTVVKGSVPMDDYGAVTSSGSYNIRTYVEKVSKDLKKVSSESLSNCFTYITVTFNAAHYAIHRGKLIQEEATASSFLSSGAFASLNDLIIDKMRNVSNGSIPVNQVPAGSLLKVGTGYYFSVGTDEDRMFVGYASLNKASSGVLEPQVQDVVVAFVNELIRGGNQYSSVANYFSSFTVLKKNDPEFVNNTVGFGTIANLKMKSDGYTRVCVYGKDHSDQTEASVDIICNADAKDMSLTYSYAPVAFKFVPVLTAHRISSGTSDEGTQVEEYELDNYAENSVAGAFSDLPFFTDNVLSAHLLENTAEVLSVGFRRFEGATGIYDAIQREFSKAFAGDLFTLMRFLLFLYLIWIFLASWVCYGFYQGRLMPFIEAIKYPTSDKSRGGIDLFRIMSLGSISVDTDFKLGKMLQYDFVIAILMVVVWKSGDIVI